MTCPPNSGISMNFLMLILILSRAVAAVDNRTTGDEKSTTADPRMMNEIKEQERLTSSEEE